MNNLVRKAAVAAVAMTLAMNMNAATGNALPAFSSQSPAAAATT